MAEREAGIRVTLKSAGFLSGLRSLEAASAGSGARMGAGMGAGIRKGVAAGFASAKKTMSAMVGTAKGHIKTMATLGGAFAMGKFISDAMTAQHVYMNIAQQVNRVAGNAETWKTIQASIEPVAKKTGQRFQDLAGAFQRVFAATGDLEFSRNTMEAIGIAATATGEDIGQMANVVQLASRKFGVTGAEAEEVMARLVEKIGVGGMSLDDMNNRFAVMAGEAATAGLKGKEGFSTLLGIMLALDSSIGEKAAPGMRVMFQTLKDGTATLAKIQKQSKLKFEPDSTAFDKIRKLLTKEQGRAAAKLTFTSDARVAYDTLARPFEDAFKKAKAEGKKTEEATAIGLKAYDEAMSKMTSSNAKFSDLQAQAAERMKEDPTVIMRSALNTMAQAFTKPEMVDAMRRLAAILPKLANYFASFMEALMKHPLLVGGGLVGARVGLSFAGGALTNVGGQIGSAAAKSIVAQATAMGPWKVAGAGLGIAAGAALAYYLGTIAIDKLFEKRGKEQKATAERGIEAFEVGRKGSLAEKRATLARMKAEHKKLAAETPGFFEKSFAAGAHIWTGGEVPIDQHADTVARSEKSIRDLEESIKKQETAQRTATQSTSRMGTAANTAAADLEKLAPAIQKLVRATGGNPSGGPPNVPPPRPGHPAPGGG